MKHLFLKSKSCAILLLLKDSQQVWYPSKLAREAGASYVHATNLLSELLRQGVVLQERKGKQKHYRLTDKGAAIASTLEEFSKRCDAASQEAQKARAEAAAQSAPVQPPPEKPPAQKT